MIKADQRWLIPRQRYVPCLWPMITYWDWPVAKFAGVKSTGRIFHVWEKGDYTGILDDARLKEMGSNIFKKLYKKIKHVDKIRKEGIDAGTSVSDMCCEFSLKSSSATIEEFISFFNRLAKEYPKIMEKNMWLWFFSAPIIEKKLKELLNDKSDEEINNIFNVMSHPEEDSYSNIEEKEFDELIQLSKKEGISSMKAKNAIKDFSKKYIWFPYEYVGPGVWDEETVKRRLENDMKSDKKKNVSKDYVNLQKEYVIKYKLSEEIVKLFHLLKTITLLQDDRKMFNSQICYYVNGIVLNNLSNKIGISLDEARYIDQTLLQLYQKNKKDFSKKVKMRTHFLVLEQYEGENNFYDYEPAKKHLSSLGIELDAKQENVNEIKGQIANKGIAQGKVRVLRTSHISDFKEGDVIVTGMTTPDFVPLMKKAAAIITDEGGITSHAAITSRELNKPCIIGTKIATKVFKDGDIVEVNANEGIIKILKRK